MRSGQRIIMGIVAAVAIGLFLSSLVFPIGVAAVPPYGAGAVSFWGDLRLESAIASLIFIVLAVMPVLRPTGKTWVFPFIGSLIVLGLASLMAADHFFLGNPSYVLFTICVFAGAGFGLLVETIVARKR